MRSTLDAIVHALMLLDDYGSGEVFGVPVERVGRWEWSVNDAPPELLLVATDQVVRAAGGRT